MAVKYSGILRFTDEIKAEIDLAADGTVEKAVVIDGDGVETPIGGGGASDFTTAEVTITNNIGSDIEIALPCIGGHGDLMFGNFSIASGDISTPYLIALYKGKTVGRIITENPPSAVCTGGVTTTGLRITITGNGTITFGTAS